MWSQGLWGTVWRRSTSVYGLTAKLSWLAGVERANSLHPLQVRSLCPSCTDQMLLWSFSLPATKTGSVRWMQKVLAFCCREERTWDRPLLWQQVVRSVWLLANHSSQGKKLRSWWRSKWEEQTGGTSSNIEKKILKTEKACAISCLVFYFLLFNMYK